MARPLALGVEMTLEETPPWVARQWLLTIPDRLQQAAIRWRLEIGERLGTGNTSRVFGCIDDRRRTLVLKLAPPETRPDLEAAALAMWAGRGCVRLIDFVENIGLLLERVVPATQLPPGEDQTAIDQVAIPLMELHAVHLPASHPFPTQFEFLDVWLDRARVNAKRGTAGLRLLDQAREAAGRLCSESTSVVLLHGDFIDKNLLFDGAGYLAVDPIPRIGDPCSDVGFYAAYHPPASRIGRRARSLAARCDLDGARAARWAAVWAVGEATETWRQDSDELQTWIQSDEATSLLRT
ncbi:MAG: phosphotransferase [Actinobacteria bacterium]|nr:phosphotransferase [Actinomycetota bacterium]